MIILLKKDKSNVYAKKVYQKNYKRCIHMNMYI